MIKKKATKTSDNDPVERVIFPLKRSILDRIDKEWHIRALKSRAATVRVLLEEALAK